MRDAFEFGGGLGLPDVYDFHFMFVSLAGMVVFIAAAWMLSEVYNTWAAGKKKMSFLINTPIRIIIFTTITIYLIFNT
jgi:integrating conjugative element protein (TIGR03758 family)